MNIAKRLRNLWVLSELEPLKVGEKTYDLPLGTQIIGGFKKFPPVTSPTTASYDYGEQIPHGVIIKKSSKIKDPVDEILEEFKQDE